MYPLRRTGLVNQNKIVSGWPFANVITVSQTDPDADYSTIAVAITAAVAGDVIEIDPGTYTEILTVNKAITLRGRDRDNTEITSSTSFSTVVGLTAADAKLLNLKITHTGTGLSDLCVGVSANDCIIENCIIEKSSASNTGKGIDNTGGTDLIVRDTTITISGATAFNRCYDGYNAANDVEFIECKLDASGTGAAEIAMNHASAVATITETVLVNGTVTINFNLGVFNGTLQDAILAKNVSATTAVFNDVGFLDEAGEYQTTTDEGDNVAWCVVVVGNDDDDNIFVKRRGNVTVNYIGSAPNAGDFLITSTTGGSGKQQVVMHPAIFGVALAAGAGGKVEALLLTGTIYSPLSSANAVVQVSSADDTDFVALIDAAGVGGLTATNVPYDTITSGNENVIDPVSATELGKMVLHNTTRSTSRLITAVDTANNAITTVSSVDSWADNDAITIRSQTCDRGGSPFFIDVDLSQTSELPTLTRAIAMQSNKRDTAANFGLWSHEFATFSVFKQQFVLAQAANVFNSFAVTLPLIGRTFCYSATANGAATSLILYNLMGVYIAIP